MKNINQQRLTDEELLSGLRGDETQANRAATWLFARSGWPQIARASVLRHAERPDREDVLQEAMAAFYLKVRDHVFLEKSSARNYFMGIVKNTLYVRLRKAHRQREVCYDDLSAFDTPGSDSPEYLMIQAEREALLRAALDVLPKSQRGILQLALEGLSNSEIAEALDLRDDAIVKRRKSRGLKSLQSIVLQLER